MDYLDMINKLRKNNRQKEAVICYAEFKNKILFILRKKEPFANCLVPPGGKVEVGENVEDAVRREFFEETGLELKDINLRMVTTEIGPENYNWILFIFRGKVSTDKFVESDEGKLKWIEIEKLNDENLTDIDKHLIPHIFSDEPVKVVEIEYNKNKNWKILSEYNLIY
ncbi:NUDIX hydrolase [Thermosipho melanesiensis]|uniref:NUDIX hydrolase n=2 Tax=Thermosipho melanesiensis TaxID=46541 RepID=A6LKN6_THEM4|nr:NUDIX domain-containing protein [Thermosipho melanesiensis]ABR30487.1 NUDIX hydrolase [Thermosipho melanesiensis BI429]APT73638.1 NUDIX hydrolase [Thermosipho melanesiensis]OOC35581.1 NUDIX hydrolase [Thermosipho melanesiensis]OOC39255.1 NUDIX hydrolase [Thermosipho melanesiensis]OOC39341.1 NUDIX hydrolase [Thermosipho melanesiensis]